MYASFWVKFDQLSNGMTILDTGKDGVTFLYRDQKLMALIYENGVVSIPLPQECLIIHSLELSCCVGSTFQSKSMEKAWQLQVFMYKIKLALVFKILTVYK